MPVKYIANNAEENLEKSKKGEKNSLTLFETTVKWEGIEKLKESCNKFDNWLDNEIISSAQLYRLLKYEEMNRKCREGRNINRNILWHSHLRYDVARNLEENNNLKEEFLKLVIENIDFLRIPVCYAIYLDRDRKNR